MNNKKRTKKRTDKHKRVNLNTTLLAAVKALLVIWIITLFAIAILKIIAIYLW